MNYTKHQLAIFKVVRDLIKHGAAKIEIARHVFGFGPIEIKANKEEK